MSSFQEHPVYEKNATHMNRKTHGLYIDYCTHLVQMDWTSVYTTVHYLYNLTLPTDQVYWMCYCTLILQSSLCTPMFTYVDQWVPKQDNLHEQCQPITAQICRHLPTTIPLKLLHVEHGPTYCLAEWTVVKKNHLPSGKPWKLLSGCIMFIFRMICRMIWKARLSSTRNSGLFCPV